MLLLDFLRLHRRNPIVLLHCYPYERDAVTWQARVDQMTDRALVARWPIDRIYPVLRALFRAAGAELTAAKAPPRVIISEYVGIADAFFPDGREAKFVNAVLDHMAREAAPEKFD